MIPNIEIDKMWFTHMHKHEGYSLDELAAMPCIIMSAPDIADLIGVEYEEKPAFFSFMNKHKKNL